MQSPELGGRRVFFGYPSKPEVLRETYANAAAALREVGIASATTWEDLRPQIQGRLVINRITDAIDAAELAAFDVTEMNQNVMFELGYAIGSEKCVWLLRDPSFVAAQRKWDHVGLLSTVGCQVFANSDDICSAFLNLSDDDLSTNLFNDLIRPTLQAFGAPSVFYLPSLHNTEASRTITLRVLAEKRRGLRVVKADPSESSVEPLAWYAQEIYPAALVVVHFTSPAREHADVQNARSALIAGMALGMKRNLLMLAEEDYFPPLDYRDLLVQYKSARDCASAIDDRMTTILAPIHIQLSSPKAQATPLRLATELRSLRLGEHVAENEEQALSNYFVETAGFQQVLAPRTTLFVGRKGSGKTANLIEAASRLGADPRNLVVVIKPEQYEWESLLRLIEQFDRKDSRDYLLQTLWRFLIESEIARATLERIRARPAGPVFGGPDWELVEFITRDAPFLQDEFAVRLEKAVEDLSRVKLTAKIAEERSQIADALQMGLVRRLRMLLGRALVDKSRVAVLVDNLDKPWDQGVNLERLAHFILGLLGAVPTIASEFEKSHAGRNAVNVSLAVFIRSDIYTRIARVAPEPDKLPVARLTWEGHEMLMRVVEERYTVARGGEPESSEIWDRYFTAHVDGEPTPHYLAGRVLPRPRDFLFLCNAAITAAVNKRHAVIQDEDIRDAERLYSQFAFEAIQVEDEKGDDPIEPVLFEFVGAAPILAEGELRQLISRGTSRKPETVIERLRSLSFIGIEAEANRFDFSDDPRARQLAERKATQLAERTQRERRFLVHAAFRPYLGINDVREKGHLR